MENSINGYKSNFFGTMFSVAQKSFGHGLGIYVIFYIASLILFMLPAYLLFRPLFDLMFIQMTGGNVAADPQALQALASMFLGGALTKVILLLIILLILSAFANSWLANVYLKFTSDKATKGSAVLGDALPHGFGPGFVQTGIYFIIIYLIMIVVSVILGVIFTAVLGDTPSTGIMLLFLIIMILAFGIIYFRTFMGPAYIVFENDSATSALGRAFGAVTTGDALKYTGVVIVLAIVAGIILGIVMYILGLLGTVGGYLGLVVNVIFSCLMSLIIYSTIAGLYYVKSNTGGDNNDTYDSLVDNS